MERLLFITWDGPQVSYLEGLFFPILKGLKPRYEIHVVQFTWGEAGHLEKMKALFESNGMEYTPCLVTRKPMVALGSLWTLLKGRFFLKRYIIGHRIDIVFPRTTFPAWMIAGVWDKIGADRTLIFDMDGFPLEERIDFMGLNPNGFQYKFLKKGERYVIQAASAVLVRTKAAIQILKAENGQSEEGVSLRNNKFHVVINGRDSDFFVPAAAAAKRTVRQALGVKDGEILLVYSGSLGPQYCVREMITLFGGLNRREGGAKFLVLSGNPEYLDSIPVPASLKERMIIKTAAFGEVPLYLGAADIGLAIRANSPSMKGVSPVKLGEYLLCGLPVVASKGIGDTESFLSAQQSVHLLPDHGEVALAKAAAWIDLAINTHGLAENARRIGLEHFSLKSSIASYQNAFNHLS